MKCDDINGILNKELMKMKSLVCLYDESGTRVNIRTGKEAAIITEVSLSLEDRNKEGIQIWSSNADWEKIVI